MRIEAESSVEVDCVATTERHQTGKTRTALLGLMMVGSVAVSRGSNEESQMIIRGVEEYQVGDRRGRAALSRLVDGDDDRILARGAML